MTAESPIGFEGTLERIIPGQPGDPLKIKIATREGEREESFYGSIPSELVGKQIGYSEMEGVGRGRAWLSQEVMDLATGKRYSGTLR